ncbi:hypothetical protein COV42_00710 [Candidatus Campbellbacteria bacterium CG11_big_fil_rev_8_21_14_0_20_44_21]|uniref:Uncharacterized protein n=1 Tax=Candidatus Campbellbacteria bacterium CG22_combo_CG10-13_8_21_14_all_43_18 TaxID=1974530 RepID=A0A2H0DX39_9BACT|nr:MAG: hypothetical protein COW82_00365 [Candidatus Campbellbacteria bacterium CG22_combo_CG10-13_8_21_14_all_43_18]PIR24427.1 MAG: hypothetical protein COV42_00710 [Candidatus Campbellbacteria bacterium CG11_big_fil_rev_8_21_14_0_20_44_21]
MNVISNLLPLGESLAGFGLKISGRLPIFTETKPNSGIHIRTLMTSEERRGVTLGFGPASFSFAIINKNVRG